MIFQIVPLIKLLREPLRNGKSAKTASDGCGVRIFTLTAVTKNDFSLGNTKASILTEADVQNLWAEPGDIFIQRSNTPELVGTAALYEGPRNFASFPDLLIRVRPSHLVLARFLVLYLHSNAARRFFQGAARGIAGSMPKIGQEVIEALPVPVPSVDLQCRIVTVLDTQISRLDEAISSLSRVKKNLQRARASVLKAAVHGQLVPTEAALALSEGRGYEPASSLLARAVAARRAKWERCGSKGKYIEPATLNAYGLNDLPQGWTWTNLDHLVHQIEAGRSFSADSTPPKESQVGIVKVSAVTWGRYQESESKTVHDPAQVNPDYFIRPGDFLFSRANTIDLVGAAVIVDRITRNVMLSDKILRLHMAEDLKRWTLWVLRSQHGRQQIEALATGNQESMRNIGQERIRQIAIPLPPPAEQRRIVAEVDRRFSVLDAIELTVNADLDRCARLRQSLLKGAFEGRLVPPKTGKSNLPLSHS